MTSKSGHGIIRKLIYCQYLVGGALFLYGVSFNTFVGLDYTIAGSVIVYLAIAEHIVYAVLHRRRKMS